MVRSFCNVDSGGTGGRIRATCDERNFQQEGNAMQFPREASFFEDGTVQLIKDGDPDYACLLRNSLQREWEGGASRNQGPAQALLMESLIRNLESLMYLICTWRRSGMLGG
jgi:hypothetical protein